MAKAKGKSEKSSKGKSELSATELRDPQTPAHKAALKLTCRYVGRTYYEGDKISFRGAQWECHQGEWVKEEEVNPNHLAAPQNQSHLEALDAPTCQFLGKTRYEGDLGCWQGVEYVCHAGQMQKTGNSC